jgi:hypothetical protein
MNNFRTRQERLHIVLDIAKKLRNYELKNGSTMDLYNDQYSFIPELKNIFNEYVKQDDELPLDFSGLLRFEEIGKDIEYVLPSTKNKLPLFVIRIKNKK